MKHTQAPTLRLLVVSDTHSIWPYGPHAPAPEAEMFIHCGDLTQAGDLASFKRAIADIKTIDTPLKLIIAGHHDVNLDEAWVSKNMGDEAELDEHRECVKYMKAQEEFGIHYLDEGVHEFEVKNGKSLRVYASPYTPESNEYAFAYGKAEDRFNLGASRIPEGVDIVMTHGPPNFSGQKYFSGKKECRLDANKEGEHLGCEKLASAIRRVKPALHCFGHVHEGRGSVWLDWEKDETSRAIRTRARGTLFVNGAVDDGFGSWLIDIEI